MRCRPRAPLFANSSAPEWRAASPLSPTPCALLQAATTACARAPARRPVRQEGGPGSAGTNRSPSPGTRPAGRRSAPALRPPRAARWRSRTAIVVARTRRSSSCLSAAANTILPPTINLSHPVPSAQAKDKIVNLFTRHYTSTRAISGYIDWPFRSSNDRTPGRRGPFPRPG